MAEATDLLQLRKLNLELLRKLTAGQETMRRLVAKVQAASGVGAIWVLLDHWREEGARASSCTSPGFGGPMWEGASLLFGGSLRVSPSWAIPMVLDSFSQSSLDSGSGYATETPSSREVSSLSLSTSPTDGAHLGDACRGSEPSSAGSRTSPLPTTKHQHQESLSPGTPHSSPLLSAADSREPDSSELEDLGFLDARAHQSSLTKVTWEEAVSNPGCLPGPCLCL